MSSKLDQILNQEIANSQTPVNVDEPLTKMVIFRLADSYYAFVGSYIKEILPSSEPVFFLPGMPASVEGVVNLRGEVEAVINLYGLLQLEPQELSPSSNLLLAKGDKFTTCIRVDELLDVVDITSSLLKEPPANLPSFIQPLVSYLFKFKGLPVTGLDINSVLQAWQQS